MELNLNLVGCYTGYGLCVFSTYCIVRGRRTRDKFPDTIRKSRPLSSLAIASKTTAKTRYSYSRMLFNNTISGPDKVGRPCHQVWSLLSTLNISIRTCQLFLVFFFHPRGPLSQNDLFGPRPECFIYVCGTRRPSTAWPTQGQRSAVGPALAIRWTLTGTCYSYVVGLLLGSNVDNGTWQSSRLCVYVEQS